MTFSLGIVGAGQFSGQFAALFQAHPGVGDVHVTDLLPERAEQLAAAQGLAGTFPSYQAMLESEAVDAVAVFTQRWTHGPLVLQGLNAGKHVYSAVPMAITTDEIADLAVEADDGAAAQQDAMFRVDRRLAFEMAHCGCFGHLG